ncbi:MAG: hypothetical protein JWO99_484 [Candidatus Saccharibacteria bacterium]|nr:hypothetical protein [Candidatus Saccharibacteria bacterium]
MTEFAVQFRDDELDEEDLLLHTALRDLQAIVTDFMLRAGKSINELTEDEQQELVDRIDPHLEFEIQISKDIYKGMSIVVNGAGAFLITDQEGTLGGAQITLAGDVITGVVSDVQAYPVPSREIVRSTGLNDAIPTYDMSLSAVIIIENATFYTSPSPNGSFQVTHDLGTSRVLIPTVYGMDTRVADIDR